MCWKIRGAIALALRFEDPEQSAEVLATEAGVTGMVALGDGPAYIAALAAERLRIPYNSPDSVLACHDKFMARERFRAAGLLVPEFLARPSHWAPSRPPTAPDIPRC